MTGIQILSQWGIHTPNDGSQVGGVQPSVYAFWRGLPLPGTQAMLAVEGPSWSTLEAFCVLPPIPSLAVKLSLDITIDAPSLAALALVETDLIRVLKGQKRNYSSQRILAHPSFPANSLQVSDVNGKWAISGETLTPFIPGVPLRHQFFYGTNRATGHYGTEGVLIAAPGSTDPPALYEIPPDMQELQTQATKVQITLAPLPTGQTSGRAFILIDQVNLEAQ